MLAELADAFGKGLRAECDAIADAAYFLEVDRGIGDDGTSDGLHLDGQVGIVFGVLLLHLGLLRHGSLLGIVGSQLVEIVLPQVGPFIIRMLGGLDG